MKCSSTCIFGNACLSRPISIHFDIRHSAFDIHHSFSVSFIVPTGLISFCLPYSGTHAGTAEPIPVAPPQAAVYLNANYLGIPFSDGSPLLAPGFWLLLFSNIRDVFPLGGQRFSCESLCAQ